MGVNPSSVDVSGEGSQGYCANHRNQACDDRSTVAVGPRDSCQESAYNTATDDHEDVHKRPVTLALKKSSRSPTNDAANENPCKQIHTYSLPKYYGRKLFWFCCRVNSNASVSFFWRSASLTGACSFSNFAASRRPSSGSRLTS